MNARASDRIVNKHKRFEKLLSGISTKLINIPVLEINGEIQRVLRAVVEFLGMDRGSVFLFSPDRLRMDRIHSWTEAGILPLPDNFETEEMPWTARNLLKKELVIFEKVEDLLHEASMDKEAILKYRIKSAIMVPMLNKNWRPRNAPS